MLFISKSVSQKSDFFFQRLMLKINIMLERVPLKISVIIPFENEGLTRKPTHASA